MHTFATLGELRNGIDSYIRRYNTTRAVLQDQLLEPDPVRGSISPGRPGRLTQCLLHLGNLNLTPTSTRRVVGAVLCVDPAVHG